MIGSGAEGRRLPMAVITGYLGAGKTTLVNRLLAAPGDRRIAVLVNDFGAISIDAELIARAGGDTIALTNGCICCTIGGDLYDAIDVILRARDRPDLLVIEASGVADPGRIAQIAVAEPELELRTVVCLADALNVERDLSDARLADSLERQIRAADRLVVTKADLVAPSRLHEVVARLAEIAPGVEVAANPAGAAVAALFRPAGDMPRPAGTDTATAHDHATAYATWHYRGPGVVAPRDMRHLSQRDVSGCLRLKGTVLTPEGRGAMLQRAGVFWSDNPVPPPDSSHLVAIGLRGEFRPDMLEAAVLGNGAETRPGRGGPS